MRRSRAVIAAAISLAALSLAACSEDDRERLLDDGVEFAVRNFAAMQGAEQFRAAGHPIDGGLSCTAAITESGREAVEVECTGTTEDGGEATLTGTTAELPGASITELKGDFTAAVDGETVFTTDELGG